MDLTRRRFLGGVAGLGLLAGCADDDAPLTAATPTATATSRARTVDGVLGNRYTFEEPPARVFGDLDVVASLGVVPVGSELYDSSEWSDYQLEVLKTETQTVRYTDGPNFEAIAATRPDLILTAFADETHHRRLAEIAPTVYIDNTQPWREVLRNAAVPLFREAEAELAIGEVELGFERFAEAHPDLVGTQPAALYVGTDNSLTVLTRESALNAVLVEMGFAELEASGDPFGEAVSPELFGETAVGDFLLVMVGEWRLSDPDEPLPERVEELLDSSLIANSPAAAGGVRVFPDEGGRAGYYFTPLYLTTYLQHWEDMLGDEPDAAETGSAEPSATESGSPST